MSLGSLKTCFKCGVERPISEFYKHSRMGDGHLNKCKECTKSDVRKHRAENLDKIQAYDRSRGNLPHRVAARMEYQQTEAYRQSHKESLNRYFEKFPNRRKAQVIAGNAIRDGRLKRQPCLICGERGEAHHPDYDAPLDVVWLCTTHHKQAHALAVEITRSQGERNARVHSLVRQEHQADTHWRL
jgi:hypothetical protein